MSNAIDNSQHLLSTLGRHVLLDGFKIFIDLSRSRGSRLVDGANGRTLLDLYGFYGSLPVGFNHPYFDEPEVKKALYEAARIKVANADVYSAHYVEFVQTFNRVMGLPPLERYFFIEGGAMAVENALKAAMDWKVRKNIAAGMGERGTEILHFERAFHGRSGYTLSLTNTDPRKTEYFAKFSWPRVSTPRIEFSLAEPARGRDVQAAERVSESQIRDIIAKRGTDIAAIILETIQGEGGDNHFRGEWLRTLRQICDESQILLIFDEVQCGMGATGRNWCCQHFDVLPDLLAFGKKSQVCGVMAGPRLDEVPENCFRLPGRINSTWGGSLTDMVRSRFCLEIIEREKLVDNAAQMGRRLLDGMLDVANSFPMITAVRGRGLMVAFDLPAPEQREQFYRGLYERGVLAIRSGQRSIRFRPALDISPDIVQDALEKIREQCRSMHPAYERPRPAAKNGSPEKRGTTGGRNKKQPALSAKK
jgi:L-lysine 6-transaminase